MFEHRQRVAPDFAPPLRDDIPIRDDFDEPEAPRVSLLSRLIGPSALRRALSIVPLAIIGYALVWFLYFEPSQNVTARPTAEAKPQVTQTVIPSEPAPPARQEVAEAKLPPMPMPAPAATMPVAPSPPPVADAAAPARSLSKDEVKELQAKLGAAGFTAGPIDGVVGPQTEAALRRYAQSRRLARPEPTQETLLRLRSETVASQ
ncbi:Putative peptidoglycan binding domain-containing protein [Rhodospirillales bacterium URHD0017]|nr:Putative peptidoglycan binding domain-containing protein [Rhodospirillales bacterium URHD0017]